MTRMCFHVVRVSLFTGDGKKTDQGRGTEIKLQEAGEQATGSRRF